MCIYYRTTFTNKRIIWNKPDENIFMHFKCGHCFECQQEKSDEIVYRGYYEALNTFNKNGYTLFDTLSYREKDVPHINEVLGLNLKNNFYCFRKSDITNFLKLLRIRLTRIYNENNTLKVFYTGEYGTDENCTHRPHIHIIFYYTGKAKPHELSTLVSDCWIYGRTDGVKYKGLLYLYNKRVFSSQNAYNLNQTKYISKYVQKESSYDYMIKLHCNKVLKELKSFDKNLSYSDKLEVRKKLNCIRQFKRISNNFGEYAMNFISWDNVINGNTFVTIPDNKKVVKQIILPRYFIRKKFQNLVYYNIGNEILSRWDWNEKGKLFIENKKLFNINNNINKIRKLSATYGDYYINSKEIAFYESNRGKLLNNNFKYLINYNSPKYKELYSNEICLTDKPIDISTINIKFQNLHYLKDNELDILINSYKSKSVELGKLRHKRYLFLRELENNFKYLGLK